MHLKTVSKLTRLLCLVGVAAIAASVTFGQVGSGRRAPAVAGVTESCSDYPTSLCASAPSNFTLTFRGSTSGCTPTSGSCLADEWFKITAVSPTYCFQFCDRYRWAFGDATAETSFFPYVYHKFEGAGARTVNLTISNNLGNAGSPTLTIPVPIVSCAPGATTLCLNNGRFQVRAIFSAPTLGITNAPAQVVPLTSDTGYFWFFSANNVEVVIKVVDGRAFNNSIWVFYGALSDVEYTITVIDTATGAVKIYSNPAQHLASVADTGAFPSSAPTDTESAGATPASAGSSVDQRARAESASISDLLSARPGRMESATTEEGLIPSAAQACSSNATTLCLNNGRFEVRAIFSAPTLGITNAPAQAVSLTSDTGYFWFFSSNNVEIVAKAVDGRAFNNFFWFFYGALSDVEYTITVTDTQRGTVKTYVNSPQNLASVADTAAFRP